MRKKLFCAVIVGVVIVSLFARGKGETKDVHPYADLGLPSGTLWATTNLGAATETDKGDYFAWGETTGFKDGKKDFSWKNYSHCDGTSKKMTKYCTFSLTGDADGKRVLDAEDDAATAKWGSTWQLPSEEQWKELLAECSWTWTTKNGMKGYKITSKTNGTAIFLPFAGYYSGETYNSGTSGYWMRTRGQGFPSLANCLYLESQRAESNSSDRCKGYPIRPVRKK